MTRRDLLERKMDARTSRDSLVKKGAEWSVSSEMTQKFYQRWSNTMNRIQITLKTQFTIKVPFTNRLGAYMMSEKLFIFEFILF